MPQPTNSKAYAYVTAKGWEHRVTEDHIILERCPCCGKDNWHFYIRFFPQDKDGVWDCKVCGEGGNLYQLAEYLDERLSDVISMRDAATQGRKPEALPNVDAYHEALMNENPDNEYDALEYISNRGYSMEIVERFKLGVVEQFGKRWLVIPYFQGGKLVFVKYRTLPPAPKEFLGLSGREAPLFNSDCLSPGMDELFFVEGEGDALSMLSNGIENVVGVPGANLKKAAWIAALDEIAPKTIYILYDNDKVGQAAAKEMAKRIGIDKVRNIVLPPFTYMDGDEEKQGKDINEWFRAGHTVEELNELKATAKFFSVDGVQSVAELLEEIREDIATKGSLLPKWKTKWEELNRIIGGFEEGDLVGIMAEGKVGKTTMAEDLLEGLRQDYDETVMMYCNEMRPKRLVTKWISNVTDTPQKDFTNGTVDQAMAVAANSKGDYLFAYTTFTKRQEVYDTIRQAVRRYGVKFVCFDNLQLMVRNIEHSTQETSVITKEFKNLAMELGIVIFLIIQPHRVSEGQIIAARNASGSSAIEKDVDVMLCLHRERVGKIDSEEFKAMKFMEVDTNFAPELLIRADLTRFAAGGVTTLKMLGELSKVVPLSYEDKKELSSLIPVNDQIDRLEAA